MTVRIEANFSKLFDGNIWKLINIDGKDQLVGEIRNEEEHQTHFFILDLNVNMFIWEKVSFEEEWWIGIEAALDGVVVFHWYEDGDNPDAKIYFGVGVRDKEVKWQIDGLNSLQIIKGSSALGTQLIEQGDTRQFHIDLLTGEKKSVDEAMFEKSFSKPVLALQNKDGKYPFHYTEGHNYFDSVKKFLFKEGLGDAIKALDYLEVEKAGSNSATTVIISYYIYESEKLANYLLVIGEGGEQFLKEKLADGLDGIGLATFFVIKDKLVVVRKKKELVVYNI